MTVPNLLGLTLRCSELEIRSDIIVQLVLSKQGLPTDVLTRLKIGEYGTGLICNNNSITFAQDRL
jgi:hypothetical protein